MLKAMEKANKEIKEKMNRALFVSDVEEASFFSAMRHAVEMEKLNLVGVLTIFTSNAFDHNTEDVIPTATGLQLIYDFALVHDDVIDKDDKRAGKDTIYSQWDESMAILVGDAFFAHAFNLMTENAHMDGVTDAMVSDVIRKSVDTNNNIGTGQVKDILIRKKEDVTKDEYLEMLRLKVGSLYRLPCEAGAVLAGADKKSVKAMGDFGENLSLALWISRDTEDLERAVREGKRTMVVIYASEKDEKLKKLVSKENRNDYDVKMILDAIRKTDAVEKTEKDVEAFVKKAKEDLEVLPPANRKHLLELVDHLVKV